MNRFPKSTSRKMGLRYSPARKRSALFRFPTFSGHAPENGHASGGYSRGYGYPLENSRLFSAEQICKPGSVIRYENIARWSFICDIGYPMPDATYPGGQRAASFLPYSVLLRVGFTEPVSHLTAGALLPHLCTLTASAFKRLRRYLSVALALRSPSLGVTQHPALRSPDFPQQASFEDPVATTRSAQLKTTSFFCVTL